ncbi:alpha/beta fold hydrolase [Rhizobium sp. EC-SD404]|uniref:alpha/beta hydrolase n=1 Tax=Rhizobium sp. EC-SD404 TaxID=2038389 RepID=UPI0012538BF7|nr:alpha/beta fold hydrolase [Rhizobium sp. EC-SD404]VVT19769.1 Alpha/beta hydrolase [Rhizobium sp. EC-SD404]
MARVGKAMRRLLLLLAAVIFVLFVLWTLGPRPDADTTVSFEGASLDADLDAYLERTEAVFGDIRPNQSKQIVWADPIAKQQTSISLVYVHGFSASPTEVRPLPDLVAQSLGANLFFTRLAGHGRTGDAMAEATVNQWVNDIAEAIEIGRRLGDRVVLMGTSTGATLVTWAMTRRDLSDDVSAAVMISPNFGLAASGSGILTMPWGGSLAELLIGSSRSFTPRNAAHEANWTTTYPTAALLPMAALVDLAAQAPIESIEVPTLFVYSEGDTIVRPDKTAAISARWGAPTQTVLVTESDDPQDHLVAGDIISPSTTEPLAASIVDYLATLELTRSPGLASRENM